MIISSYVDVILPLPFVGTFTYSLPEAMQDYVTVGSRVIVPFGRKKFYTGIISGFAPVAPTEYQVKEVLCVLDKLPIVRRPQIQLWEWIADYYLCTVGEAYRAAIPAGLKIESETMFESNPDFDMDDISLMTEKEAIIFQVLASKGKLSAKDLEKETGFRNIPTLMQRMVEKGAAIISETLVERFRPKKEKLVKMAIRRGDEEALREAFAKVKGAKKQETMLMTMLQLSDFNASSRQMKEVQQDALIERSGCTTAILKALVDKGIVERYTREISRFSNPGITPVQLPPLSEAQAVALNGIHASFASKPITLLHGVTSSGKTEIYAHLIDFALKQQTQVLYLVPEIALTSQLTTRLQHYFGNKLIVYHSKFSDNERVEIWNKILHTNEPIVVIGARSSVFLPFAKLGLVIVDEEHDQSYKQFDPAPRYNGRDTAIMLAHMHGAKTLLGSATPSVETYYKATSGKYGLVTLSQRFNDVALPEIEIVDVSKEWKKKAMDGAFAMPTVSAVRNAIKDGQQALIFHNRRGYSPLARCTKCQFIPKCQNCDVSLTYHRRANTLVCHYCGANYSLPEVCPACKEPALEVVGYGTERVEDEVERIFPDAKILRMDLDTTRNKNSYGNLIEAFSERKANILVGTQMITKGMDFDGVEVVAVVSADSIINFPDFRSAERAFNMLEQVSGRAGRRDNVGKVLIQTHNPENQIIDYVKRHDYMGFYNYEIAQRQAYAYPPFSRLIYIILKHKDERELDEIAKIYGTKLRELFGNRVHGPSIPTVSRVQSLYIRNLMLKVELTASMKKIKDILRQLYVSMCSQMPSMRGGHLYYDVDPY